MSKPSDGFELDELRDEFDWMCEFNSRMAERIRGDADVHNLAEYVSKLEGENDRLRELVRDMHEEMRMVSEIWAEDVCAQRMQELGIEVD